MALISVTISGNAGPLRRELGQAEGALGKFGKAAGAGVAAAGAAVAGIAAASVSAFANFDSAMTQSVAIMTGVTDDLRKQMETVARSVAKDLGMSASDSAKSFFYLASAGLNAEQSMAALPQVAAFAKAGMFDMALATDLATDAQSALGLASKDTNTNLTNLTRVTDVLVKANTLANATVQQFSEALTNKAGAAMKTVGMEVEEGVAVLAAFADQGVKGAEAGTQFSIVLRDLQTKALENAGAFKQFGVEVFDSQGELNNMGDIIGDIEGALGGMSDAQVKATLAQMGFADKSVAALLALVGTSDKIKQYEQDLKSAGGTTQDVAEKQLASFSEQMNLVKTRIADIGISIGSFLAPHILTATQFVGDLVDKGAELAGKLAPHVEMLRDAFAEKLVPIIRDFVIPHFQQVSEIFLEYIVPTIKTIAIPIFEGLVKIFDKVVQKVRENRESFMRIYDTIRVVYGFIRDKVAPVLAVELRVAFEVAAKAIGFLLDGFFKILPIFTSVVNGVVRIASRMVDVIVGMVNGVISSVNLLIRGFMALPSFLRFGIDISEIPKISLTGTSAVGGGGGGGDSFGPSYGMFPGAGTTVSPIVTGGLPGGGGGDDGGGSAGGSAGGTGGGGRGSKAKPESTNVTVNVNGALATKAEIGDAVIQAIRASNAIYGPFIASAF